MKLYLFLLFGLCSCGFGFPNLSLLDYYQLYGQYPEAKAAFEYNPEAPENYEMKIKQLKDFQTFVAFLTAKLKEYPIARRHDDKINKFIEGIKKEENAAEFDLRDLPNLKVNRLM